LSVGVDCFIKRLYT